MYLPPTNRPWWLRYGIAVGFVAFGWLLRAALTPIIGPARLPFVMFFPAVALAAWFGGLGPGVLSLLLSAAAAFYFYIEPVESLWSEKWDDAAAMAAFAFAAAIILAAIASMHRARRRMADEIERRKRAEIQMTTTLTSIGDAVIATDMEGRVKLMNGEAQRLTGWSEAEARDRRLSEVFHIVNEDTRQTVESPVDKALRTGTVVGLANHTILIGKHGAETPIDDSAAPIRDAAGALFGVVLVFRDVATNRAARQIEGRLAAIVESSGDAILTKNLHGIIQTWNIGAERLFGYRAEEVVGKPITILFPPDRLHEEEGIMQRLREGLPYERFETVRTTKDGRRLSVSQSVSPLRDADGQIIGAATILHDISEVVPAHKAAEHAARMKDEFLATLSHELRTPLNAVLGYATLMRMGKLSDEELTEAVEVIERNARAQAQLIEDLLDMNRIVSGKIELDVQPVQPADVVGAALATVRPSAEAKRVRLPPAVRPSGDLIAGDAARLQQVIWNLLSNAVKFTPEGGEVRVDIRRVDGGVQIIVSDTGQGIDAEFLPFVFDRFRQADASMTRRHGGLGLGLSIVRHLVELHGGTVQATSAGRDQGSTFTVTLPPWRRSDRRSDAALEDSAEAPAKTDVDLRGIRALVVDDEHDAALLVERILRGAGAEVVTVASAREAIERLGGGGFDVLVSDISMPGEDGYSLIHRAKTLDDLSRRLPAVALTAFARREDELQSAAAGFDAHLAKPVDPGRLTAEVARLTGRAHAPF